MAEDLSAIFEAAGPGHHIGLFYSDLGTAMRAAREYAYAGLRNGDFVCLVAPAEECEAWGELTTELDEKIRRDELPDLFGAVFFPLSEIASEDGRLRVNSFLDKIAMLANLRDSKHLRVFGRLMSPLWEVGFDGALLDAESAVGHKDASFSFLCLYDISGVNSGVLPRDLVAVKGCHTHTLVQVGPEIQVTEPSPEP